MIRIPHLAPMLLAIGFISTNLSHVVAAEPALSDSSVVINKSVKDEKGFLIHTVQSPYQAGKTKIRILLPEGLKKDERLPVLYLLPVEAGDETRYGDGLLEAKRRNLHNRHRVICVAPTFSQLPWYADHPTDKTIRQESYFLRVVIPFVESSYPASDKPQDRLLAGFSKSGWGAFSLLLRHPDKFGKAAAWDAPLNKQQPNQFGMGPIFGSQENFEQYKISSLLKQKAENLRTHKQLVHLGYGNFRDHHQQIEMLLDEYKIPHVYRDGPQRKHDWHSGWLSEAADLLFEKETP